MDERLSQEQQRWLEACVKDINEGDNLFRLFKSLKPIMINRMRKYLRDIPYYDEEDYFQTGLITLWDNIERIKNNPEIAEKFLSYYAVSVEHAYIRLFYNFVMKNDTVVEIKVDDGTGYNVVKVKSFQAYRDKIAERQKKYNEVCKERRREAALIKQEERLKEQLRKKCIHEKNVKYYEEHREEIRKKQKEKRDANLDEFHQKERDYYWKNHDRVLKTTREYRKKNAKKFKEYYKAYDAARKEKKREYDRKRREANREKHNARCRKYRREHSEEINRRRRELYAIKKSIIAETLSKEEIKKAKRREYYLKNREVCIERAKKYYYEHREEILAKSRNRRVREREELLIVREPENESV